MTASILSFLWSKKWFHCSLEIRSCDERMDHLVIAISRDPSHNQLPNADTIAYTSKMLLKGPRYCCLLWDYAGAQQTQKWMLTVNYWMDHRAPNGGAWESIQGAKESCNPVGATLWTNQYPRVLDSSCICIITCFYGFRHCCLKDEAASILLKLSTYCLIFSCPHSKLMLMY